MLGLYNKEIAENVKTNTVYFTTACNLGCTYCYEELDTVKARKTSREELRNIADMVIEREPADKQSFFILFGGEPTLCWDDVVYFMNYAYRKKNNVHFNMITNGIRFLDNNFMFTVWNNEHMKQGRLSVEVSFDGKNGNVDRIYKTGEDSTADVVEVLAKLSELSLKFRIRYTVHKKNIDHFVGDIRTLLALFNPERIITYQVEEQLDDKDRAKLNRGHDELRWYWQTQEIQTPVCGLFCDNCDGCGIRRMNLHYYIGDKNIKKYEADPGKFHHFDKKINTKKEQHVRNKKEF